MPYLAVVMTLTFIVTLVSLSNRIHTASDEIQKIQQVLDDQKICGNSTPQYCQDLFQRLSENISDEQRQVLSCTVLKFLGSEILVKDATITCND